MSMIKGPPVYDDAYIFFFSTHIATPLESIVCCTADLVVHSPVTHSTTTPPHMNTTFLLPVCETHIYNHNPMFWVIFSDYIHIDTDRV